jgi:3-methylcrotonyl-CoA carboxylase alpha subunit
MIDTMLEKGAMFASVLIANRGEIACRIARTARRLGLRTVAVYSDADRGALHVRLADEAHPIGPAPATESYLAIDRIIAVARSTGAQCIHPGYGFLSENPEFAEACAEAGIVFVGPPPAAIRAMGLKDRAKTLMEKAGVPVVPGYHGERQEPVFLKQKAYEIGYPVLIKAVAGGGGKGMRRVDRHAEFEAALEGARREAQNAFGDARVLVEKYVAAPRHIEIQVFADGHGNAIHLNERDCSLQRRHQKVIEEAPAPGMNAELRATMGAAAVRAAQAVGYAGAGTVEFIADGSKGLRPDGYWFMEMNTRLQVEHPVTEAVTGLDLVEWQFRIAAGEKLPLAQEQVPLRGHAVEARLYAEDPARGFLPSTGTLVALSFPDGVRVDTGVEQGSAITPYYDPMIAKLIAHAPTREAALDRLAAALDATIAAGPYTNLGLLAALCRAEEFRAGRFDTGTIERNMAELGGAEIDRAAAAFGAARLLTQDITRISARIDRVADAPPSPWDATDGFQLSGTRESAMPILVDGAPVAATVSHGADGPSVAVDGVAAALDATAIEAADAIYVLRQGRQTVVRRADVGAGDFDHADGEGLIKAPMHGKVLALLVAEGDMVTKGQRLAIIEAMKMEHALTAPRAGRVAEIAVAAGTQVAEGAKVLTIESTGS